MSKFTVIAPRDMWTEILEILEPVPHATDVWFREKKPDEVQKYPRDIESDRVHWIYNVSIQHDESTSPEEIASFESRLQAKWPYVRAEKEPPVWFAIDASRKSI